jgi:phosphatidylglycerophosphate synthase
MRAPDQTPAASDPREAIKQDDGFVATFLSAPIANWMLRRVADSPITPNHVTALSALVAVAAAAAFASGAWPLLVVGGVLLQLSFVFDCLDGQLARHRGAASAFGAWLDFMTDCLQDVVLVAGIAAGCAARSGGSSSNAYLWGYATLFVLMYRRFDGLVLERVLGPEYRSVFGGPHRPIADEGKAKVIAELRARKSLRWGPLARLLDRLAPRATERPSAVAIWAKRALLFREGERYLAISLLAVLGRPEWIFPTIVVVGGVLYPLTTLRRWQLFAP